ncbi:hypothetical protein [Leptotrichia hofstadii]|uniref:ATP F0F1 synthase synthase n=1 Tax=Leptotrichia hofstadii F0254 TaxID=634994 RepID=C9N0C1_9FUSO|nr:hypothetical protein [Leptotrichia hofstadii]EEX73608.1 hypothetical protein GCWU000323_02277 [Leptotrichia hofstadii F0254]
MINIIGKLNKKTERSLDYRTILTKVNKDIYNIELKEIESIKYDSNTILSDNEWFFIEEFTKQNYCLEILKNNFSTAGYNDLEKNCIKELHYILIENEKNNCVYIQKITKSTIIKQKMIPLVSKDYKLLENETLLLFKSCPDAILDTREDKFYFRNLSILTSIFRGIEALYKEATDEDIDEFISNKFIKLDEDYTKNKIKSNNRKKILLVNEILNKLPEDSKNKLLDYTSKYCDKLIYKDGIFEISNEKELKELLYGLQERYYTTEIGREKRIANSIISIEN